MHLPPGLLVAPRSGARGTLHELRALDAFRETGIVLDVGRDHELTARDGAGDDERLEVRPRRIDGGGQARGARADDDDIVERHDHYRRSRFPIRVALSPNPQPKRVPDLSFGAWHPKTWNGCSLSFRHSSTKREFASSTTSREIPQTRRRSSRDCCSSGRITTIPNCTLRTAC